MADPMVMRNTSLPPNICSSEINHKGLHLFFAIFLSTIFVIATLGNGLAVVVIAFSRHLRSQPTYHFVSSLALADIGVVVFTLPIRINSYLHNQAFCFGLATCRLFNLTDLVFHVSSVTHLFVIAVDRYIAINSPFLYKSTVSKFTTFSTIAGIWLYSSLWAGLGMFKWDDPTEANIYILDDYPIRACLNINRIYFTVVYIVSYLIPLLSMALMYTSVLRVAMKQARAIAALDPCCGGYQNPPPSRRRRELRAAKTLFIVYGAFVICWLPITIIVLASSWCPVCFYQFRQKNRYGFSIVYALFVETLPSLNSCINPFIYIIFGAQFRVAIKDLVYKLLAKPRDGIFYPDDTTHGDEAATAYSQMRRKTRFSSTVNCSPRPSQPQAYLNVTEREVPISLEARTSKGEIILEKGSAFANAAINNINNDCSS